MSKCFIFKLTIPTEVEIEEINEIFFSSTIVENVAGLCVPSARISSQHFHQWDLRFQFECVQIVTLLSPPNSKPHVYSAPVKYIVCCNI